MSKEDRYAAVAAVVGVIILTLGWAIAAANFDAGQPRPKAEITVGG